MITDLKHRIGGPDGITVRGWLYLFPWSIWLALGFAPNRTGDYPFTWLVIGILAHLTTGLALLIGKKLFLTEVNQIPRFFTTIAIYATAGVVRGLTTGYLSLEFNSAPAPDYLLRIGICLIVVPLWLGLVAVIVSARSEHNLRVAELLDQKRRLILATVNYNQQIVQYRVQVIELVRNAVKTALVPLQHTQDASKLLIDVSEQVIRPLSHDLAITVIDIETDPEADIFTPPVTATQGQILSNMRTVAAFPVGFLPYLFMLTALPSFLAVAGPISTAITFLLIAIFIIGGFPLLANLTATFRANSVWFGWFLVLLGWLTVSLAVGFGVHLLMGDVPKLAAAGYSSVVIIFVGTLLSSILRATLIERERIESEIEAALLARKWEADRARVLLNAEQENLTAAVHSGIQGVLVAAALKLAAQATTPAARTEFIRQIELTCQQVLNSNHRFLPTRESLTAIAAVWEGIAEISIDIAEQIYQNCELDPALANTILVLIRESLSNSVRHGRAKRIWITGTLDNQIIKITITDDGQFKLGREKSGLGSKIYSKLTTDWELSRSSEGLTSLILQIPISIKQFQVSF